MGMCGEVQGVSYTGLLEQVESLAEMGCKTLVMEFSTPGDKVHTFLSMLMKSVLCVMNMVSN